jgi:fructuronate reductase
MENAAATMAPLAGIDFSDYGVELVERFRNPEIAHETRQIAMDGTEKLPQRIFSPACDLPQESKMLGTFALCFAAWMAVMRQRVDTAPYGAAELLNDPRANEIIEALADHQDAAGIYEKLSGLKGWMPKQLLDSPFWSEAVIKRLSILMLDGADAAIRYEISA